MNAPATFAAKVANTEPYTKDRAIGSAHAHADYAGWLLRNGRYADAAHALDQVVAALAKANPMLVQVWQTPRTDHLNQDDGR